MCNTTWLYELRSPTRVIEKLWTRSRFGKEPELRIRATFTGGSHENERGDEPESSLLRPKRQRTTSGSNDVRSQCGFHTHRARSGVAQTRRGDHRPGLVLFGSRRAGASQRD